MSLEGIFLCLQEKQKWPFWRNTGCFCSPSFHQCCNPQLSQPVDGAHPCGNATDVPLTSIWSLWSFLLLFCVRSCSFPSFFFYLRFPNMLGLVEFLIHWVPRIKHNQSRPSHPSQSSQDVLEQKFNSKPLFCVHIFFVVMHGGVFTCDRASFKTIFLSMPGFLCMAPPSG